MSSLQTQPRVAIIGSLWGSDLVLADSFAQHGLSAEVLRPPDEAVLEEAASDLYPRLTADAIVVYRSRGELLLRLRTYDFVFSFTASLGFSLGKVMYLVPVLQRLGWPRYANVSTGADITERALEQTWPGRLQRLTMRVAFAQGIPPYPDAIKAAARLRLSNTCLLPPVQLPVREEADVVIPRSEWRYRRDEEEFLLLSPSHLDWGFADSAPGRASTKGNDRFFHALARVLPDADRSIRVLVLDRGSDRENARRLVERLGIDDHVTWVRPMTRPELIHAMRESDLIVDQFDIGALGMIAWEAMALGRPVLTYVDPAAHLLAYDEPAPVLNAHTIDEIEERLRETLDREALARAGEAAARWARARPTTALVLRYLYYATVATGRPAADFGWGRPHGHP